MSAHEIWPPKCGERGRFIGYEEFAAGAARIEFTPDNHFGPEETSWTCRRCTAKDRAREPATNPVWPQ